MHYQNQADLCYKIRVKGQLTQKDLARLMGLTGRAGSQLISNIERGICGFPLERIRPLLNLETREAFLRAIVNDLREEFKEVVR